MVNHKLLCQDAKDPNQAAAQRSARDRNCFTAHSAPEGHESQGKRFTPKAGPRLSRHNGQVDFSPDRSKVPMQQNPLKIP